MYKTNTSVDLEEFLQFDNNGETGIKKEIN